MSKTHPIGKEITGKQVLFAVSIFFAVLFLINGIFVYYAVSTFNGVETSDAYRKGLDYNTRIASNTRQKALGWTTSFTTRRSDQIVSLFIKDNNEQPVAGLKIKAVIGRPATDKFDQSLAMNETRPGIYVGHFGELSAGHWLIAIEATDIHQPKTSLVFRHKERIRVN